MTFELAIATMHKTEETCLKMIGEMNVHCDCLIINQCDRESYEEKCINGQRIRIVYTQERGLSKSRNMALRYSQADVLGIADDDLYYYDGFEKIILDYYNVNSQADIVLFNMDDIYKTFSDKSRRCSFWELTGYKSVQTTVKITSVKDSKVSFNEYFGTGSEHVQSGEENIFLADCYKKGLQIYYCGKKIVKRELTESGWFKGWTEDFIKDRGAIYYAVSRIFFLLYILRFALKNYRQYKPLSVFKALKLMLKGKKEYVRFITDKR